MLKPSGRSTFVGILACQGQRVPQRREYKDTKPHGVHATTRCLQTETVCRQVLGVVAVLNAPTLAFAQPPLAFNLCLVPAFFTLPDSSAEIMRQHQSSNNMRHGGQQRVWPAPSVVGARVEFAKCAVRSVQNRRVRRTFLKQKASIDGCK